MASSYASRILAEFRRAKVLESMTEGRRKALERLVTAGAMVLPNSALREVAADFGLEEDEG